MSADDRMKEQMAANQMLSRCSTFLISSWHTEVVKNENPLCRVYTLMRENQEMFGETSFDQVKSQMDLYKA